MYPPKLYSGPTIQSRSAARRAAQDLVFQNISNWPLKHNFAEGKNWLFGREVEFCPKESPIVNQNDGKLLGTLSKTTKRIFFRYGVPLGQKGLKFVYFGRK